MPCKPLKLESQTPVDAVKPTQPPFKLTRGEAQARQSVVAGPVHDAQAGEQLARKHSSLDDQALKLTCCRTQRSHRNIVLGCRYHLARKSPGCRTIETECQRKRCMSALQPFRPGVSTRCSRAGMLRVSLWWGQRDCALPRQLSRESLKNPSAHSEHLLPEVEFDAYPAAHTQSPEVVHVPWAQLQAVTFSTRRGTPLRSTHPATVS